jgi:hypothetical protein
MANEIERNYLEEVCKMGQGNDCCRYIIVEPELGIVCAKDLGNQYTDALDARGNKMVAQADNCKGYGKVNANAN